MAGFLSTMFGGGAEREAAEKNRALLGQYQTDSLGALNKGLDASTGYLKQGIDAYSPLLDLASMYRQGSGTYLDALGINGAEGAQRAQGAFQTNPGYQFQMDQGLQALERRRAINGMSRSGNADMDAMRFSQGLADQSYGNWLANLKGVDANALQATAGGAQGVASGYGSLAGLNQQDAQNRIGVFGNVLSGGTAANNFQASGEAAGARNLLGGALGLANIGFGSGFKK